MDHHPGVWQDVAMILLAARKDDRSHACGISYRIRKNRRSDVAHRIDDRESGNDAPARRENKHVDRLTGFIGFVLKEFHRDAGCESRSYGFAEVNNARSGITMVSFRVNNVVETFLIRRDYLWAVDGGVERVVGVHISPTK